MKLADVKAIRVIDSVKSPNEHLSVGGLTEEERGVIYIPIHTEQGFRVNRHTSESYDVMLHELGHRIDKATCGGADRAGKDPSYNKLNPTGFNYVGIKNYDPDNYQWDDLTYHPTLEQRAVETPYSMANIREDKAEIYHNLTGDYYFTPTSPNTAAKETLLLARIYEKSPQLATFLMRNVFKVETGQIY